MSARLSVLDAARAIGCAPSTVRSMIRRGELAAERDGDGRVWLSPADVAAAPHRPRGAPKLGADRMVGRQYQRLAGRLGSVAAAARRLKLSRQDVADAIARYNAARQDEEKSSTIR